MLRAPMAERPATRGRRFLKLAGMTAQVAGSYASQRLRSVFQSEEGAEATRAESHRRIGERIAATLGELKGAVMKVGQMASIASDILPKEIADALQSLQREAPPMDYEVIAEQIERELGAAPETLFRRFERQPFASASIGQVHRATTDDGREVVVKVQYPGVDAAVDSDVAQLKLALRASGLVQVPRKALDALFVEIRARLVEELDYTNEAANVRLFYERYREHPHVVVPEVVGERSAQRILTLTYEPGDHVSSLQELGYSQELRDRLGEQLFRLMADQLFDFQTIHADPNPANMAFRRDGTVVLYDFGAVKKVKDETLEPYRRTLRASLRDDWDGVDQGLIDLGARIPDKPNPGPDYYRLWRDILLGPFMRDDVYDYGSSQIQRDVMLQVPRFLTTHLRSFQPPAELVYVDRMIVGQYGNLRTLGARLPARALLREVQPALFA
jgi:predicted unusual protein kinase regulating ubiquinone biosynthesis (AarF/ABC1/UbiB family)